VLDALPYGHRENIRTTSTLTLSLVRRLNQLAPPTDVNPAPLLESPSVARLADRLVRRDPLRRNSAGADERLRRAVDGWAGDRFAASNARLSALLGIDLRQYGWPVEV